MFNQASTSKAQPNISISNELKIQNMTIPSFKISTRIQLHNLYKTSAAKYSPNTSSKIFPELQLQNLEPNLVLKV